jgi:cytochrome b
MSRIHSDTNRAVRVWDPLVRLFHWSLVAGFTVAYVTEDDFLTLHVWAGYLVAGLVAFRLIWGVIGTRHARFTDFVRPPGQVLAYLRQVLSFRAPRYLGHNPAGGAMVVALLVLLVLTAVSGFATLAVTELSGPLAPWLAGMEHRWGDVFEEIHEVCANITLLLVVAHVAGVLLASVQHHENLVRSMFDGIKRASERRAVPR